MVVSLNSRLESNKEEEEEVRRELLCSKKKHGRVFFFFFTLVTGPRRSLSLKLSDTRVAIVGSCLPRQ